MLLSVVLKNTNATQIAPLIWSYITYLYSRTYDLIRVGHCKR